MAEQDIELVLPEGEVDIHEADVVQEKPEDRDFSASSTEEGEAQEESSDELEEYSDSVKKRINALTYKMREAERQRDEAVGLAQKMHNHNGSLEQKLRSSDATLVNEYEARVNSETERARKALKEAQELGDAEAIALATEAVAKTSVEAQNVQRLQAQQKTNARRPVRRSQQNTQQEVPVPEAAAPDPRAQDWAEKNSWFGSDRGMTFAAFGIHQELINENVDPASEEYYQRVDEQMREYFPQKFDQPKNVQQVAGSSRGAGASRSGTRKVKLSPSQVAVAKRLGVTLEDYAKYAS